MTTTLYAMQVRNGGHYDTYFYRDKACTDFVARWPCYVSGRPVRRRRVVLNCVGYDLDHVKKANP